MPNALAILHQRRQQRASSLASRTVRVGDDRMPLLVDFGMRHGITALAFAPSLLAGVSVATKFGPTGSLLGAQLADLGAETTYASMTVVKEQGLSPQPPPAHRSRLTDINLSARILPRPFARA